MQRAMPAVSESSIPETAPPARRPLDLYVCEVWGLALLFSVAAAGFPAPLRFVVGLSASVLGPGYVLVQLLFPRRQQLAGVERLGLTLLGSLIWILAWVVLLAETGLRLDVMSATVGLATPLIVGAEALRWRRRGIPASEVYHAGIPHGIPKAIWAAMALLALLTAAVAASNLNSNHVSLSLTDTQGHLSGYPSSILPHTTYPMTVHVNHLSPGRSYRVVVVEGPHAAARWSIPLHHGTTWSHILRLTGPASRQVTKVFIYLFQAGRPTPIRTLWIQYR